MIFLSLFRLEEHRVLPLPSDLSGVRVVTFTPQFCDNFIESQHYIHPLTDYIIYYNSQSKGYNNSTMKSMRCIFPSFSSTSAAVDDTYSAPDRLETSEPLQEPLQRSLHRPTRQLTHFRRSRSRQSSDSELISDDCTVLSNATTVKAGCQTGTALHRQNKKQQIPKATVTTTVNAGTTPQRLQRQLSDATMVRASTSPKRYKKQHVAIISPTSTTRTVFSDDPSPRQRHGLFWNRRRSNEKQLSPAAQLLSEQENTVLSAGDRRRTNQQQKLSLPMKRYIICTLVGGDSSETMSATCDNFAEF